MKKLAVSLLALLVFVLLAEGVLGLFFGTSLRRLGRPPSTLERLLEQDARTDQEGIAAAARTVGPYRVPEDPLVCNTFKAETEVEFLGRRFRTDALGMRARPGDPSAPGAFHLVVLGDSVAFGHGLAAEDDLAAQIEDLLRAVRDPRDRPIVCSTVAVPGWNYRNAIRHLLDHLDRIAPDLVLYVPVENDLDDGYGVTEAGQRRLGEDPGAPRPLCHAEPPLALFRAMALANLGPRAREAIAGADLDQWTMKGGLSLGARWRLEDLTASVARLAERLGRVHARLVLAPYILHDLYRELRARLIERGLDLPTLPLLDKLLKEDGQGQNPHPNAETTRALAIWAVQGLLAQGLVPGAAQHELPEVPARLAGRQGRDLTPEELARWRVQFERDLERGLERRIEPAAVRGLNQLYGGLDPDGSFGIECLAVLPGGTKLRVALASVLATSDLYPLEVSVFGDEHELGRLELAAPGAAPAVAEFPIESRTRPFEVRLAAADWGLAEVAGSTRPVAARLLFLESVE